MASIKPAEGAITLKDGRQLYYSYFGAQPRPGRTVLYFHGYLSSRLEAALLENEAYELGLSLLAFDRSGYGNSYADPTRTPHNSVSDAQQLLEALVPPDEKVFVFAASGGSPYAAAFCMAYPERCICLGLLVPYALPTGREAELAKGMHPKSKAIVDAAATNPLKTKITQHITRIIQRIPHGKLLLRLGGFSEVDLEFVDIFPEHRAKLKRAAKEGNRRGIAGAVRDLEVMATVPMPESMESITCKTVIWAGEKDCTSPPPMARFYERQIPTARGNLHMVAGRAHFLGFEYGKDVLTSLL